MSSAIRLLVVEDDKATLMQWDAEIELRNADSTITGNYFDLKKAVSIDETRKLLDDFDFDIAVVDINLKNSTHNVGNKDGNIVLDLILQSELAVVAVFSGEPVGNAEPPEWAKDVKIFPKGYNGMRQVMEWLTGQLPMISQIKRANREIKREMVKLFTRSIWPRWNQWVATTPTQDEPNFVCHALTRHLTAHVYGIFLEKSAHKVHPEEWYFIPSIRDGLRTGDLILRHDSIVEILVTPRCDLARDGKNESFQLAECRDVSEAWNAAEMKVRKSEEALRDSVSEEAGVIEKLKRNVDAAKSQFRQFSQHKGNSSVYHFLPRVSLNDGRTLGPFMVNFDKIRSVSRSDAVAVQTLKDGKFAAITPEFLPSIVERLGSYFSRFGNPDYSHPD